MANRLISHLAVAAKPDRLSRFVDSVVVRFSGGKGGDGCISMLSEFCREFGGPDGGNGGNGGHVVLQANPQVKSLRKLAGYYKGLPGERGYSKNQYGKNAEHTFVEVPVGTTVIQARAKELAEHEFDPDRSDIVAELDQEGSMFIAARGGAGGRGNMSYLSNQNRHPRVAQAGALGESNHYELRLCLYAHVGLVGLPNAGKSSLLRTLTGARVKIGDYSFTTLHPQVGVLQYDDLSQVAIADLPGLIDESHKNRGLGIRFLRNCTRCACLLYVIDLSNRPEEQLETLARELEAYRKGLSKRTHVIFGNKSDLAASQGNLASFRKYLEREWPNSRLVVASCWSGANLEELRLCLKEMHDEYQAREAGELGGSLLW